MSTKRRCFRLFFWEGEVLKSWCGIRYGSTTIRDGGHFVKF